MDVRQARRHSLLIAAELNEFRRKASEASWAALASKIRFYWGYREELRRFGNGQIERNDFPPPLADDIKVARVAQVCEIAMEGKHGILMSSMQARRSGRPSPSLLSTELRHPEFATYAKDEAAYKNMLDHF